ncbi:transposase [Pollutibacter soli]|uniref:transposase n=1 Tax=Pollutibacter soli TaxID=3034157 RepID=UPI003013FD43
MKNELYHIYNRGNQKQKIFFELDNYEYFVRKMKKHLVPCCDILAWCLMPNHFHFLIHANELSVAPVNKKGIPYQNLSDGFRKLLSSYTKGINSKYRMTGNLFQQHTRAKSLVNDAGNYSLTAFNYIHQNPWKGNLVRQVEDWKYSSLRDYIGKRNSGICNMELAKQILEPGSIENILNSARQFELSDIAQIFQSEPKISSKLIFDNSEKIPDFEITEILLNG